ncbi:MAG: serine/threonine protein kinase [Deltaproteobacteria bacterium]|nr:serine/threonine protein kinase [Deltaproteobacteria bacterium]
MADRFVGADVSNIGKYKIIEKIDAGGMATVYRGLQISLNRPVAIKVLYKNLSEERELVDRFNRESLIIARLTHPNIIHVIDRGLTSQGMPYFVMDLVEGTDLARIIKEEGYDTNQKLDVIIQVCKALSYAHKNGVIHRDVKPANILIDSEKNALVSDFKSPSEITPTISKPLEDAILKCLEPEPADRFTSADEIKDRLLETLQGAHLQDDQKKEAIQGIATMEDRFDLLDVITEHQFGAVYLFRHKVNGQLMVVKKCKGPEDGLKEAKLLTTLKHKNIVNIYGVSGNKGLFIIVMEYISGGSLKERLVRPHSWIKALKTAKDICEGLAFAHKNRVVHGNLRPSNILISASGEVKITDFGLNEHYSPNTSETNWYNFYGTPRSNQTDIFSAGVIFYEMLIGLLPVWKEDGFVPHKRFKSLPAELQAMIFKMIARDPEKRYENFDEVLARIDHMLAARRRKPSKKVATTKKAPSPQKAKKKGLKQYFPALFLLVLLLIAALAYLDSTGKIDYYLEHLETIITFWTNR